MNVARTFDLLERYCEKFPDKTDALPYKEKKAWNPKMQKVFLSVGSIPVKHYITYRYLFNRNAPFKRYPVPE